jgi:hypothetical protein
MKKERNYTIRFKNPEVHPIQFRIITDEAGNCRVPGGIKIKNETHQLNTSGTYEQVMNWIKETLWKFEIEEIKENE